MNKQETPRQQKINNILQKEVATLLQQAIREGSVNNLLVSVTKVHVTSDLSISKVYLSIFPTKDSKSYLKTLQENSYQIRYDLAKKMKNQLRKVPELHFYLDDSLDYIEVIDKELNEGINPLKYPGTLSNRKKK
ncbi:MAG: 30S ribosome-binding factor RbfA [Flavobacteriaceae bacterium]|nr:ribosome-binding factor A [Flavobacteriaceae bacterium]MDG2063066.1 30S ribosome-binding factor RbfA [Flavobacteriaceae bacterium]